MVTVDTDVELAVAGLQDMGSVVTLLRRGSVSHIDSVLDLRSPGLLGVDSVGCLREVHPDNLEEVRPDSLEEVHPDSLEAVRPDSLEAVRLDTQDQGFRMFS